MSGRPALTCRLVGREVAEIADAGEGLCELRYLDEVQGDPRAQISVRLPVRPEPYAAFDGVQAYLDGVLPEGWVRDRLAARARLPETDTFGLLARYGGDCAGAVSFHEPGSAAPLDRAVDWLAEGELIDALRSLRTAPLGDTAVAGLRLSLGGVQEKLVVVRHGDRFGLPLGDQPSTHILKPAGLENDGSERFPGVVAIEHLCMALAARIAADRPDRVRGIGFRVPETEILRLGGRSVLAVTRYDREDIDGTLTRIHQEDGCQMLGLRPALKYERGSADGQDPSLRALADALQTYGAEPALDRRALLQGVAFSALVGNADLHAKNLSVIHRGGVRLAPLYDIVATGTYQGIDRELGLRIGGQYHLDDVDRSALVAEGRSWGLGENAVVAAIGQVIEASCDLIEEVAGAIRDEGFGSSVFDEAVQWIGERADRLRQ